MFTVENAESQDSQLEGILAEHQHKISIWKDKILRFLSFLNKMYNFISSFSAYMRYETIEASMTCLNLVVASECRSGAMSSISFVDKFPFILPTIECNELNDETLSSIQIWNDFVHSFKDLELIIDPFGNATQSLKLRVQELIAKQGHKDTNLNDLNTQLADAEKAFKNFSQLYGDLSKKIRNLEKKITQPQYTETVEMISEMVALSQADTVYSVNQLFNLRPTKVFDTIQGDVVPDDQDEVE